MVGWLRYCEKGIKVLIHKIDQKNPYSIYKNIKKFIKIFNENKISLVHARSRAPAWSSYYAAKALKNTFHHYMAWSRRKRYIFKKEI